MFQRSSKSGLFLMEMIIVIMFFSLVSAVSVQLFVKSHFLNKETVSLNHATLLAQNYAEVFRNMNGNFQDFVSFYHSSLHLDSETSFSIYYDENWKPCDSLQSNGYIIQGHFFENESIHTLNLDVFQVENHVFIHQLSVDKYVGL